MIEQEADGTGRDGGLEQRAAQAFRRSDERLLFISERAQVGYWDWEIGPNRLEWSPLCKRLFGIPPDEEITYERFLAALHPEDRDGTDRAVRACLESGGKTDYDVEFRTRWPNGTVRWIHAKGSATFENGRAARMAGVVLDISDRKRTEDTLRERDGQFRLFIETAPAAIAIFDRDMRYLAVSRRYVEDFRLGDRQIVGRSHYDVFPELPERWKEIHQRCLAGAIERVDEDVFTRQDGRLEWLRWELQPWYDGRGKVDGLVLACEITTEQKRSQEALLQSEERFRTLANIIPNLAWIADEAGWIFWYNQRWYEYTGTTPEQMEGWGCQSVHDPDVLPEVLTVWKASLATGQSFDMVFPLKAADGQLRLFLTRVVPLRDGQGKIVRWFGTNTDIDEQKRTERDLRRANQDLEQFAYSASHDLQEPLRTVAIYAQLMQKRYGGQLDAKADEFLSYMTESSKRMQNLVTDLLAYTQAASFDDQPVAPISAEEVLAQVLQNLEQAIRESNAVVTYDPLPIVAVKEAHFLQLLQNLVGNALKYRTDKDRPEVHVSAVLQKEYWRFSVRDNGIGIDPQYQEHVFGIFKRLHGPGSRYAGTGIGLAICQKIVERYGGRIWVESESDRGATFHFTIPILRGKTGAGASVDSGGPSDSVTENRLPSRHPRRV